MYEVENISVIFNTNQVKTTLNFYNKLLKIKQVPCAKRQGLFIVELDVLLTYMKTKMSQE